MARLKKPSDFIQYVKKRRPKLDYQISKDVSIDWERSIIINDKYHILIGPENDAEYIKYIQGARVIVDDILATNGDWTDETRKCLNRVIIKVYKEEYKLSEVFDSTPWGLMNKNLTGIGATTLELGAKRDSIIVVPTKALAVSKVISRGIIEGTDKFKCYYFGSKYQRFENNPKSLKKYIEDQQIEYKKFVVVSDSLGKLIDKIEESGRKREEFFLLVDEIDSYQYDNTYRPNMEKVIDHYFTFLPHKRSMLSATVNEFSNPMIKKEPFVELEFIIPITRSIKLIHTFSICAELAKYIEYLCEKYPKDKILIAYNSITNIMSTINLLDEHLRPQCAVYCSEKSQDKPDKYYAEFSKDRLQEDKRIHFVTCTYFVGIDIMNQYHLVSVSDVSHLYSVLSTDKFTQIAGRCRHEDGLLSETLIYNTFNRKFPYERNFILDKIHKSLNWILFGKNMAISDYFKNKTYDTDPATLIEHSKFSYCNDTSYELLREDINGELTKSYLNIDAFLILQDIKHILYTDPANLPNALRTKGHKIEEIKAKFNEYQIEEAQSTEVAKEGIDENIKEAIGRIIDELRVKTPDQRREHVEELLRNHNPYEEYLKLFLKYQIYVPFEDLVRVLPREQYVRTNNEFEISTKFWALDDNHPVKHAIKEVFQIGERVPRDAFRGRIKTFFNQEFNYKTSSDSDATRKWGLYCEVKKISNREHGHVFEIISYDPLQYNCKPENPYPLETPANEIFPW